MGQGAARRAYSLLTVKSFDEQAGILTGIATSPTPDRQEDIIEPKGLAFKLPLPLLYQHKSAQPIGWVTDAKVKADGIHVVAKVAKDLAIGWIQEAWTLIREGLVAGFSVGIVPTEYAFLEKTGGIHILAAEWVELSVVTVPANAEASILTVKTYDVGCPASGTDDASLNRPGASGSTHVTKVTRDTKMAKKPIADQIAEWVNTRAAKVAAQEAIQEKAQAAGRAKDESEREEFDGLGVDIKDCDREIADLRAMEAREKAAVVASGDQAPQRGNVGGTALVVRGDGPIRVQRELPKGIAFARYAMCVGLGQRGTTPLSLAQKYYPDDQNIHRLIEKAAVAGGSTTGSHWLDDMVPYSVMADFIEYLRPGSIVGKFGGPNPGGGPAYPALNRRGFNERVSGMSTGFTAAWKGEGLPALPSAAVTFNQTLTYHHLAAMAILTKEAIRFSNPAAESVVRDDLARAVNYKMDYDFVDPAKAAVGTTSPASITDAIAAIAPTGTTAAKFRADLATALATFATANLGVNGIVIIMSQTMATQLSMMINTLGNPDFPNLNMQGGAINGIPVIVSELLTSVGSPSTQLIVVAKADEIYLADDGVVTVEASDQASVEMQDTSSQSGISGTGASLVSLWQNGLVGLLADREVTWKRRRTAAVQYISPAAYVVQ